MTHTPERSAAEVAEEHHVVHGRLVDEITGAVSDVSYCAACGDAFPCDVATLAVEIERLRRELAQIKRGVGTVADALAFTPALPDTEPINALNLALRLRMILVGIDTPSAAAGDHDPPPRPDAP